MGLLTVDVDHLEATSVRMKLSPIAMGVIASMLLGACASSPLSTSGPRTAPSQGAISSTTSPESLASSTAWASPSASPTLAPSVTPVPTPEAQIAAAWIVADDLPQPRGFGPVATLLLDGTVLLAGGDHGQAREQRYDPGTGRWTETRSMADWRFDFTATRLADGRVLVTGGRTAAGVVERLATAELYDPRTGRWTATASMAMARAGHTATLLSDGTVLVAGGHVYEDGAGSRAWLATAELYDPDSGRWTSTGNLTAPRGGHVATLLPGGTVLVAGGATEGTVILASAELYDPGTGRWVATEGMANARYAPAMVALPDGTVIVVGSEDSDAVARSAERYDPASGRWTAAGPLDEGRHGFIATVLDDGRVLVAGGRSADRFGTALATAELFDPERGHWTPTAPMHEGRIYATATLLTDGTVLVAGGVGVAWLRSSERYDPGGGS